MCVYIYFALVCLYVSAYVNVNGYIYNVFKYAWNEWATTGKIFRSKHTNNVPQAGQVAWYMTTRET